MNINSSLFSPVTDGQIRSIVQGLLDSDVADCNAYVWEVEYNRHDLMLTTRKEIRRLIEKLK